MCNLGYEIDYLEVVRGALELYVDAFSRKIHGKSPFREKSVKNNRNSREIHENGDFREKSVHPHPVARQFSN